MEGFVDLVTARVKEDFLSFMSRKAKVFPIFRSSPFTSIITYNPFRITKTDKKKRRDRSLWSTHVVSLVEATRAVLSSGLYPIVKEFLDILNFSTLRDYLKYHKGLKITDSGRPGGEVLD